MHKNNLKTNGKLFLPLAITCLILMGSLPVRANAADGSHTANAGSTLLLDTFSSSTRLPNGVQVHGGQAVIQAEALRDDVIRIRVARDGNLPEDSSWAVLPAARSA